MYDACSAEIGRQDGAQFRAVGLSARVDSSLRLSAHDMGKLANEMWGDDDCEL
jgi:hypothetical protein